VPEQTINLSAPGKLLVSGVADLRNKGPSWAHLTAAIVVDHVVIARPVIEVEGYGYIEVPLDGIVPVRAGAHTFAVAFEVEYSSYKEGDLRVDPVTLWAATLPH
jgi:hypothetical protein